jgi:hypothetical protein
MFGIKLNPPVLTAIYKPKGLIQNLAAARTIFRILWKHKFRYLTTKVHHIELTLSNLIKLILLNILLVSTPTHSCICRLHFSQ